VEKVLFLKTMGWAVCPAIRNPILHDEKLCGIAAIRYFTMQEAGFLLRKRKHERRATQILLDSTFCAA